MNNKLWFSEDTVSGTVLQKNIEVLYSVQLSLFKLKCFIQLPTCESFLKINKNYKIWKNGNLELSWKLDKDKKLQFLLVINIPYLYMCIIEINFIEKILEFTWRVFGGISEWEIGGWSYMYLPVYNN